MANIVQSLNECLNSVSQCGSLIFLFLSVSVSNENTAPSYKSKLPTENLSVTKFLGKAVLGTEHWHFGRFLEVESLCRLKSFFKEVCV